MQLYPTPAAAHLAITGVVLVGVGIAARTPAIVGWGGALILAMAIARVVTLVSVSRIRAAGFEMLWSGSQRVARTYRGGVVEFDAEVRNRDTLAVRYVKLRAVASSHLKVTLDPASGEVAGSGRLRVKVKVHTPRVGLHGVHGLALEVHGASGLFEVPLTFANPYGIEVLPRPFATYLMQARGGRSHRGASPGQPGRQRGEGHELRELREHQPGDPFRRIAWKASARRGQLLVRDFEREERNVVWGLLDATPSLWAGPLGWAPLDLAVDEVAARLTRYLARGDRVGLYIYAAGHKVVIPPDHGPLQGHKMAYALVTATATHDAHRSELDEFEVAARLIEHLRPLDGRGLADVRRNDLDKLALRARAMLGRAPFAATAPVGRTPRDQTLRGYLAAFGIESPAKVDADPQQGEQALQEALQHIALSKPGASLIDVVAPPPDGDALCRLGEALKRVMRKGAVVSWSIPPVEPALARPWDELGVRSRGDGLSWLRRRAPGAFRDKAPLALEAVRMRAHASQLRREVGLRRLGVRILRVKHLAPAHDSELGPMGT